MEELEELEIEFSPRAFEKLPPTLVVEAEQALRHALRYRTLRAKQNWQEVVLIGGCKYGLNCRKIGNNVRVSGIVRLKKKKKRTD